MQKYRRILLGRATFLLIDSLVIVVFLTVWMVAREAVPTERTIPHNQQVAQLTRTVTVREVVPTERTIPYNRASDHILVQLAKLPEHPGAQMRTSPIWTLYGNGRSFFEQTQVIPCGERTFPLTKSNIFWV